jgi:hypothetical protein
LIEEIKILKLIHTLFPGPIDIIGDIHGEIAALQQLLDRLGYNQDGIHPDGRRLVFVGDLVDRGPDSPAVVELVKKLVENKRAQCILGNHELNLLRGDPKHGNEWFMTPDRPGKHPCVPATGAQKLSFIKFLQSLPLALQRDDLRVVHACWNKVAVEKLSDVNCPDTVLGAYRLFASGLAADCRYAETIDPILAQALKDEDNEPEMNLELASHDVSCQMGNPVKIMTSGEEAVADKPFWANGKWRMVARQKWWEDYADEQAVVVGHYWRHFGEPIPGQKYKGGPDLFKGIAPHHWMGKHNKVYCVDFSVGHRHRARANGLSEEHFKLAALRWPEKVVMHDDGKWFGLDD